MTYIVILTQNHAATDPSWLTQTPTETLSLHSNPKEILDLRAIVKVISTQTHK